MILIFIMITILTIFRLSKMYKSISMKYLNRKYPPASNITSFKIHRHSDVIYEIQKNNIVRYEWERPRYYNQIHNLVTIVKNVKIWNVIKNILKYTFLK